MRVYPANDMVMGCKMIGGKVVIINLQKTVFNEHADLVIHALIDDVVELLMQKLEIEIPPFKLERWAKLTPISKTKIQVSGSDMKGENYDLFKDVKVNEKGCIAKSSDEFKVDPEAENTTVEFTY